MNWLTTWTGTVERGWLDELDHVNFLQYQRVADFASLDIWNSARGQSGAALEFVMVETHTRYIRELRLGMDVVVSTALLAFDSKRFHLLHHLKNSDELMCSVETLNLCFDPAARKVANFNEQIERYFQSWPSPPSDARPMLSMARR